MEEDWNIEGDGTYVGQTRTQNVYSYSVLDWTSSIDVDGTYSDDNKIFKFTMPDNDIILTVNGEQSQSTNMQTWQVTESELHYNYRDPVTFKFRDLGVWYNMSLPLNFSGLPKSTNTRWY